jgi:hypothetical protein
LLFPDEKLNLARPIANIDEEELTGVALADDAAGGANPGARHLAWTSFLQPFAEVEVIGCVAEVGQFGIGAICESIDDFAGPTSDFADRFVLVEPLSPWIVTQLGDSAELLAASSF